MKKSIFLILLFAFIIKSNAQVKFYTNNGATAITETKCGDFKDLTVKVPIPADVSKYDAFIFQISFYKDAPPATCEYNKNDIKSKLAGKKEVTLLILSADGKNTDFKFSGYNVNYPQFCDNPRKNRLSDITIREKNTGWIILSYNTETKWDEAKQAYVSTQVPVWDKGEVTSEGELKINQLPPIEEVNDKKNIVSMTMVNGEKSQYDAIDAYKKDYEGGFVIHDKSIGETVTITTLYFDESKFNLDFIKNDILKVFSGTTDPAQRNKITWQYFGWFNFNLSIKKATPVKPVKKSKDVAANNFETVNIGGKDFYHFVYTQTVEAGFYPIDVIRLHFYVYYKAPYTSVTCCLIKDEIINKGPETIAKAEEIIKATIGSINIK